MSMIPRFIDPIKGRVLIDGIPVTELKAPDLRDQIGLVSQDSVLFNDTVWKIFATVVLTRLAKK